MTALKSPLSLALVALLALPLTGCPDEFGQGFSTLEVSLGVSPSRLDLSPLWAGRPQVHRVSVSNSGDAPAVVTDVRVLDANGPASVTASFSADRVPPSGNLDVEVRFAAPEGATGLTTGRLVLSFQDESDIEVPFTAEVRPLPPCDDGNPCTEDSFDGVSCVNEVVADQTPCDDDNACTQNTMCAGGRCLGQPVTCVDVVDCTVDTCDPEVGCVFQPIDDRCDDEDPCTDDVCSNLTGCSNLPVAELTPCFLNGCETVGLCTAGLCLEYDVPDGFPCEDGDLCTLGDSCQEGACTSGEQVQVSPEEPVVTASGEHLIDFCLNASADGCGSAWAEPEEVLAATRYDDGMTLVIWRSAFVNHLTGAPCEPYYRARADEVSSGFQALIPPDEAGDVAEAPPAEPVCGAGVFLTRTLGAVNTTAQLSSTRGPAAAHLFGANGEGLIAVTTTNASDAFRVLKFTAPTFNVPAVTALDQLWANAVPFMSDNPTVKLALDSDGERVVLASHTLLRKVWDPIEMDGNQILEAVPGIAVGAWAFSYVPANWQSRSSFIVPVVSDDVTAGGTPCVPDPLLAFSNVASFDVHLEGDHAWLSFIVDPRQCASQLQPAPTPYMFAISTDASVENEHVAPLGPPMMPFAEPIGVGSERFVQLAVGGAEATDMIGVIDVDGCTAENNTGAMEPECTEEECGAPDSNRAVPEPVCTSREIREVFDGEGLQRGPVLFDGLVGPGLSNDVRAINTVDGARVLVRIGRNLHMMLKDADGQWQSELAPEFPNGEWWEQRPTLTGEYGVVAGLGRYVAPCECPPDMDGDFCDCGPPAELPVVAIQTFSCRASVLDDFGCLDDAQCGASEACDVGPEHCLPPPTCEDLGLPAAACEGLDIPDCAGKCEPIAGACDTELTQNLPDGLQPPDAVDLPECPAGALPARLDYSPTYECVDPVSCVPWGTDAGVPDGGQSDGGAGADSGFVDDGGVQNDGGPGADGGSAADGGLPLDGGAVDGGPADAGADASTDAG